MQISTLSILKPKKTAQIVSIIKSDSLSNHSVERLYSIGICPGEKITIQNRVKDLYIVKTEMNNPFCLREDIAKFIQVRTDKKNLYPNITTRNKSESFIQQFKEFLSRVF